jgi:Uma2 family endonuclease
LTEEAIVLFEILSPSTTDVDFGPKLAEYLSVPALQAYLIVAQDSVCVWAWIKGEDGFPNRPEVFESRDAVITLDALGLTLPVGEIYRHVDL